MRDILTFVLAGGKGERLDPLTRDRAKPAVPFGGIFRIIDFTLSNCVNSGLRRIFLLTQYKSFSLQRHIIEGWNIYSNQLGEFIDVVPAQQRISSDWYRGTADAIYQNLNILQDYNPKMIMILAGDHVYKMDYRKLIDFHVAKGAAMTVACLEMDKDDSVHFGVVEVDSDNMVVGFQEKPKEPKTLPHDPTRFFGSMGIYLFNVDVLAEQLRIDAKDLKSEHDFGKNIIPQMVASHMKVYAYDFANENPYGAYWKDIGTRDSYFQANMDLLGSDPKLNIYDKAWPIRSHNRNHPPLRAYTTGKKPGTLVDSLVAGGCVIESADVSHSVIAHNVTIKDGVSIKNSVIMDGVSIGEGSKIQNAIIDKDVAISPGTSIGFDDAQDRARFILTTSGIVIVAKKMCV